MAWHIRRMRMKTARYLPILPVIAVFSIGIPQHMVAADYSDPTWPCIQRKVENLSVGLMWQYPIPRTAPESADAAQIRKLADTLSLRRIDLEDIRPDVEAFANAHNGSPDILGQVFEQSFDGLNSRRSQIISGIGDFSLSQIALSEQIDAARSKMDTLLAAENPDYDQIDKLEERLDWDQLIFSDRSQSITYLCETPQLIERRLFAIAQLLASVAKAPE